MCDICGEVLELLNTYDPEVSWGSKKRLKKTEIATICNYVQSWCQRQCMCVYREPCNYDRFNHLIQGVLWAVLELLRTMELGIPPTPTIFVHVTEPDVTSLVRKDRPSTSKEQGTPENDGSNRSIEMILSSAAIDSQSSAGCAVRSPSKDAPVDDSPLPSSTPISVPAAHDEITNWTLEEKEHLLQFATKAFLLSFPHYSAYKHNVHAKLEDISQQEATVLSVHCDTNDPEIPIHLLRNVCFFCDHDALLAMTACFIDAAPETLPFCLARAMISIVSNLKLWLNVAAVVKYLVPLRTAVIHYMCKLSDKDLRAAGTRSMSEFMWTAVKDPLDSHLSFDREGLDLAFKYFTSSTLTMRLAGLAHINNHVTMYNELCSSDAVVETEALGVGLADWLIGSRVIENIFGPNLHVEIIKQSHVVLNFLAMEGCITNEHVDSMWTAAQLKHCSKQVHDLLLPLIKHLEPRPVVHLYQLLGKLEPHDHSEQTLYLASALLKVIWSNGNIQHPTQLTLGSLGCDQNQLHHRLSPFTAVLKGAVTELANAVEPKDRRHDSSTEHSVSLDSSDDTQGTNPTVLIHQHPVHSDGRPLEQNAASLPSNIDLLQEWANEDASFTSSDNDSDNVADVRRHRSSPTVPGVQGLPLVVSLAAPNSDSDERCSAGGSALSDDDDDDNAGECGMLSCRRKKTVRERHKKRQLIIQHRKKKPRNAGWQKASDEMIGLPKQSDGGVGQTSEPRLEPTSTDIDNDSKPVKKRRETSPIPQEPSAVKEVVKNSYDPDATLEASALQTAIIEDNEECEEVEDRDQSQISEEKVFECMQFLEQQMQSERLSHPHGDLMEDIMSADEATCSSRLSNKSDKNMEDFEGEESGCDAELIQLTSHVGHGGHLAVATAAAVSASSSQHYHVRQHLANMASMCCTHFHRPSSQRSMQHGNAMEILRFDMESVCHPGQTLLWDLLQDESVVKLGKGLAMEAEKVLSNLVCWSTDRIIRMKFIEGCLQNLANNKSIYLSLRLLPRLFGSFQQYRGRVDTHTITMWAEKDHHMMEHFFNNLLNYTQQIRQGNTSSVLYSHQVEIQVRLQFLTCIFSSAGSPDYFRLSVEQVDTLWWCLANDVESADELFNWFLIQTKNKDEHALGMDALFHIFTEKLPLMQPETTSMTALNLLQQLGTVVRHADEAILDPSTARLGAPRGMDQLWGIALRAHSTDVSMAAIQYLNSYYVGGHLQSLEREEEFIQRCMTSLASVLPLLEKCDEASLVVVQRALLLLKTHLETFHRRYAFHLRTWHLEGRGISSHQRPPADQQVAPLRVICQPAGITEKIILELLTTDFVADLRADVTHWWEQFQQKHRTGLRSRHQDMEISPDVSSASSSSSMSSSSSTSSSGSSSGGAEVVADPCSTGDGSATATNNVMPQSAQSPPTVVSPILGAMLTDGPIRVITQGQELTTDFDERTLGELGFKDMQLVFVSVGAPRPNRKRDDLQQEPASSLPPPPRERLPASLLLQTSYFEQLFRLIQQLSQLKVIGRRGNSVPHTKAQLLSWRVWEILMMLPTCPETMNSLRSLGSSDPCDSSAGMSYQEVLRTFLDPQSPHKLMYSLQIVETLMPSNWMSRNLVPHNVTADIQGISTTKDFEWAKQFVEKGGLRHLFDIFMSGILQSQDKAVWSEWHQDCLAYLLKLIYQLGLDSPTGMEIGGVAGYDNVKALSVSCDGSFMTQGGTSGNNSMGKRKSKKQKRVHPERIALPKLNQVMLTMLSDVPNTMRRIVSILYDAGRLHDNESFKVGVRGRGQVVHYTLSFLLSWLLSRDEVFVVLFGDPYMTGWLRHLLLDDPEPSVRQEICGSLYRLCMGTSSDGHSGQVFIAPLLNCFLGFLHCAQNMKSPRLEMMLESEKDKEPYGPACRDYFWLVCRLVENLNDESLKDSINGDYKSVFDLDGMATRLAEAILTREFLETRHNTVEDDGLVGLFNLCTVVIKHNPTFKFSKQGQEFLLRVFDCLFALPSPKQRHLPLCKSQSSRSAAYDLVIELTKGCFENYAILHQRLMQQHSPNSHSSYPWDYWPHEDGRSDCGYVGLTNLGATCYMASCMQHLYMMPEARASILSAKCSLDSKHESMLRELQRMFAYLLESERKAYNPRSFCKVYTMDHQPLNTGEQKDMAEFFTDLISKLEEMTPQLKELVKTLFQGVITNNVVSLDCSHVSRTLEECYTVRCQVADMRNLYESLDEVTVKDTLEGDNMYTCSQCGHKVRAEKRACFKKLPRILCFNTMRYTFNMVTMMKEKVNTHFSFPLRLDMSKYTEKHLMPDQYRADGEIKEGDAVDGDEYDLIGVTVHTGTADGGHYYSFIRDRLTLNKDKWFLFNDAEVKPFDSAQLAAECFGGEMTSKTYDSVTDKFMDFSFEKTNSAYMLFYERVNVMPRSNSNAEATMATSGVAQSISADSPAMTTNATTIAAASTTTEPPIILQMIELPKDLADWIWEDNMQFLQDRNIFEHTYFNFISQVCGYVPQSLMQHRDVTLLAAKLSTSFVLETLIHAKEKPTMVQWIELLTKLFNSSQNACEWFLNHMADHEWWPVQILIRCPNQVVRQMFQRLCIHVINKLRPVLPQRIIPLSNDERENSNDGEIIPCCVTRFVGKLLSLIEHGANQHTKHLTEYFAFLVEFAKMSCRESQFLLSIEAISTVVNFYLGHKAGDYVDPVSDEEEEETDDVLSMADDKCKPVSLEKMVALVAMLVEKSRGDDHHLHLSESDFSAVAGGKGFPFLCQQIRDNINIRQTCNLIFSLCRWNEPLAIHIIGMVFQAISQHPDSQPFYKLMSMLVEITGGPPGLPAFTKLVLQHIWDVADNCPQQCLEWLSIQVPRNKLAHTWVLQRMEHWVEAYLIAHSNQRVRNAAAFLLVSLIPSSHFKQAFRTARNMLCTQKEIPMTPEALIVLHHIYDLLLRLLKRAKHYVDTGIHGTTKLTSYFALMTYCLVSHTEKLMFGQYFMDLWQLFQPKLSEPPIAVHQNKQALLTYWYQVSADCPENIKLIVQNAHVTKNIAFNYILADHEDQDVMIFNRYMLPAYYGLLRLCCQHSRPFTRQLAGHQNIQWAFKNVTPYSAQYGGAVDELNKLMRLFVVKYPDSTEQELKEIVTFKCTSLQLFLSVLDGRSCWATLLAVVRILVENNDDRFILVYNNGIPVLFEAFQTLHVMYHEATACHVTNDLTELLVIILDVLRCARNYREGKGAKHWLLNWKDRADAIRKLVTLLNSYASPGLRTACIDVLRELLLVYPIDCLQCLVPIMTHSHSACQENAVPVPCGPYFPRRGQKSIGPKSTARPPHPVLQMTLHPNQLEAPRGLDPEYDLLVNDYFTPYHALLDIMCRVAVNNEHVSEALVNLSVMVGIEGIPLHLPLFPKLWLDIYEAENVDQKCVDMMCSSFFFVDYVERLLLTERICLSNHHIFQFLYHYMPKIACRLTGERMRNLVQLLLSSLENALSFSSLESEACRLNADILALKLLCQVDISSLQRTTVGNSLEKLALKCRKEQRTTDNSPSSSTPCRDPTIPSISSSSSEVCSTTEVASCSFASPVTISVAQSSEKEMDAMSAMASTSGIAAFPNIVVGEAVNVSVGADLPTTPSHAAADDEPGSSKRQKLEEASPPPPPSSSIVAPTTNHPKGSLGGTVGTMMTSLYEKDRPKSPRNPDRTEKSSVTESEKLLQQQEQHQQLQVTACPDWVDILAKTASSLHSILRPAMQPAQQQQQPQPSTTSSSSNE